MASSEDTTALHIQAEINEILVKGDDEGFAEADEHICKLQSDKLEKDIKNGISLFLILFKSNSGILEQKVKDLREVADGLERVHFGTTVGSLTGGVVSAVGGVTSVVGLFMAPFTLGASLAVTWAGVGIATAGGVTSGVSNITKMVNESMDRKNFEKLIKDYEDLMKPITECLEELSKNIENLQKLKSIKENTKEGFSKTVDNIVEVGSRMGKGLVMSVPEVVRLVQVVNLGKVAAKASKVVQVVGMFTVVLSGLFVALDGYFIYKDSKEIHNMRKNNINSKESESKETEIQNKNGANKQSAAVEFIAVIKDTAKQLEDGLDELREMNKMLNEGVAQRAK